MKRATTSIISWLSSGIFTLLALGALTTGDIISSIAILILAFLVTPLSQKYLFSKLKLIVPTWGKVILGVVLFLTFVANLSPATPKQDVAEAEIVEEVPAEENVDQGSEPEKIYYEVTSITDGDTIKVLIDNKTETIRLANINTPESVDLRRPVECMGNEASQKMTELVSGKKVYLEQDETQGDKDQYNRLLRFIFLENDTDVGLEMIKLGYAQSSPYGNSPHKYLEAYTTAQEEAQTNELGLWSPNSCPAPTATPATTKQPTSSTNNQPAQNSGLGGTTTAPTSQPSSSGVVKKSTNDICHAPGTTYYDKTTNYTTYNSVDECLASGGRLPKR